MTYVLYTAYNVHYTIYSVHCTLYTVHLTLQCTMYNVHTIRILHKVLMMYSVHHHDVVVAPRAVFAVPWSKFTCNSPVIHLPIALSSSISENRFITILHAIGLFYLI